MPRSPVLLLQEQATRRGIASRRVSQDRPRNCSPSCAGVPSSRTGRFSPCAFQNHQDRKGRSSRLRRTPPETTISPILQQMSCDVDVRKATVLLRTNIFLAREGKERAQRFRAGTFAAHRLQSARPPGEVAKNQNRYPCRRTMFSAQASVQSHHPSLLSAITCGGNFFPVCFFICGS